MSMSPEEAKPKAFSDLRGPVASDVDSALARCVRLPEPPDLPGPVSRAFEAFWRHRLGGPSPDQTPTLRRLLQWAYVRGYVDGLDQGTEFGADHDAVFEWFINL